MTTAAALTAVCFDTYRDPALALKLLASGLNCP